MWSIECAKVIRPYPRKNHDRVFIDTERKVFGVFDGAGDKHASSLAVATLAKVVTRRRFNPARALQEVHKSLLREFAGRHLTTGALVQLSDRRQGLTAAFASAGDSPIYSYDHRREACTRLTVDESRRHAGYIDAHNFLGSPRHRLQQIGRLTVAADTTLLLVTDGITDEHYAGHVSDEQIGEILSQHDSAASTARLIMEKAAPFDDTTVVVVQSRLL